MNAPIVCFVLGHVIPADLQTGFINRVGAERAHAIVGYCGRCGVLVALRADREMPARKTPDLWPLLLKLAPKAKLSQLGEALWEQGLVVDMLETKPLDSASLLPDKALLDNSHDRPALAAPETTP